MVDKLTNKTYLIIDRILNEDNSEIIIEKILQWIIY